MHIMNKLQQNKNSWKQSHDESYWEVATPWKQCKIRDKIKKYDNLFKKSLKWHKRHKMTTRWKGWCKTWRWKQESVMMWKCQICKQNKNIRRRKSDCKPPSNLWCWFLLCLRDLCRRRPVIAQTCVNTRQREITEIRLNCGLKWLCPLPQWWSCVGGCFRGAVTAPPCGSRWFMSMMSDWFRSGSTFNHSFSDVQPMNVTGFNFVGVSSWVCHGHCGCVIAWVCHGHCRRAIVL